MESNKKLQRIQSAPDAIVRQVYATGEDGKKTLDHVVWSSKLLGEETIVRSGLKKSGAREERQESTADAQAKVTRQERKD